VSVVGLTCKTKPMGSADRGKLYKSQCGYPDHP